MLANTRLRHALLLAVAACTGEAAPPPDGLVLDVQEADHVVGAFTENGHTLRFDLSRAGSHHEMSFATNDGTPMTDVTIDDGTQTTSFLGGRFITKGIPNAPNPTTTGDVTAQEDLVAMPEARLMEGLSTALLDAGIDPDLLAPAPPKAANNLTSGFQLVCPGENVGINYLSAAGASPTYIYARTSYWNTKQWPWTPYVAISPWSLTASYDSITVPQINTTYWKVKYWWGIVFTLDAPSMKYLSDYQRWYLGYYAPCMEVRASAYVWSPGGG